MPRQQRQDVAGIAQHHERFRTDDLPARIRNRQWMMVNYGDADEMAPFFLSQRLRCVHEFIVEFQDVFPADRARCQTNFLTEPVARPIF